MDKSRPDTSRPTFLDPHFLTETFLDRTFLDWTFLDQDISWPRHFLTETLLDQPIWSKPNLKSLPNRAGQFFFRVEWVELVVKLTKLSHWGLVPGHLLQNWVSAFDLKFQNLSEFFCPEPSQYSTWHVSFASYRHNKLAVDGSNAHTIHAHYTDSIVSLTFTSKFFAIDHVFSFLCAYSANLL